VNVTGEFIEALRDTDPRLQNVELDTAFHVAAKSSNQAAILHLLSTFKPTNAGWDIDSVDENRGDTAPTLVNMCAGDGVNFRMIFCSHEICVMDINFHCNFLFYRAMLVVCLSVCLCVRL